MKRLSYGLLLLLLIATVFFSSHAGRLLSHLSVGQMLGLEYSQGSLWKGTLFARPANPWRPLWLAVEWQWCPNWRPNRWCVDMQGAWSHIQGKLLIGWHGLELRDARVRLDQLVLPFTPYLEGKTNVVVHLEHAAWNYNASNLQALTQLHGQAQLSDLFLSGLALEDHQLTLSRRPDEDFMLYIEGTQVQGTARLSGTGDYMTDVLLTPGNSLENLLQGQLPEVSDGSFRYQTKGRLEEL